LKKPKGRRKIAVSKRRVSERQGLINRVKRTWTDIGEKKNGWGDLRTQKGTGEAATVKRPPGT